MCQTFYIFYKMIININKTSWQSLSSTFGGHKMHICPFINKCQLNCQCNPYHSTYGAAWQKHIGPLSHIQKSLKCHVSFSQPLTLGLQVIQNQVSQPPTAHSDEVASNWIWKYLRKTLQYFKHLNVAQRK